MQLFQAGNQPHAGTNITGLLQQVIDEAVKKEVQPTVVINYAGVLVIDQLHLRSHLHLVIPSGCTLQGSGNEANYYHRPGPFERLKDKTPLPALIAAENVDSAVLDGGGAIDGNYRTLIAGGRTDAEGIKPLAYPRPEILYCEHTRDLTIQNLTFQNSAFWTIHLLGCEHTTITHVQILNDQKMPNTDGIDVDRSRQTRITSCTISTGDDAICAKCTEETARFGSCEDLYVDQCVLSSKSAGIKLGSNTFGDFSHLEFHHLTVLNSNRGLAIQMRNGGKAQHIKFADCTVQTRRFSKNWWGHAEPIYVTAVRRYPESKLAAIDDISFENINCDAESGLLFWAEKPGCITGLTLNNIHLLVRRPPVETFGEYDLRPTLAPDIITNTTDPVVAHHVTADEINPIQIADPDGLFAVKRN